MRKNELLKHIPKEQVQEGYQKVFKACGKDVIMVTGWPASLYGYGPKKYAVHFAWKEGYLTWYEDGTWTRESADVAGFSGISMIGPEVSKFLKRVRAKDCHGDLDDFERLMRWNKQRELEHKKQKRIDNIISIYVPPLPKGFTQKIKAMAKDLKPGNRMYVKMFQQSHDGVIERMFTVERRRKGDGDEEYISKHPLRVMEICVAFTDNYGDAWNHWYYGQHYFAYGREQSFWPQKRGMVGNLPTKYRIYDNFAEEDMTRQQESCLRIMDGLVDPTILLNHLHFCPALEQLIKAGMTRMAADLCDPWLRTEDVQDRVESLGQADRQLLTRIRENNAGWKAAQIMADNPKLNARWIREITKIKSEYKMNYIRDISERGLNMNHVFTLLSKTGGIKENVLQKYLDYLRMAEGRGSDIHDEIIYRNKRWEQFHDAYVEENLQRQREEQERRHQEELQEKAAEYRVRFVGIGRDYGRNRKIFSWKSEGVCMVVPKDWQDIVEEGQKQHHCVGSLNGRYMESMSERKTWIIFLRHAENPEEPWYTIETDGKKVLQFYAAYDRQPDKEEVQKILTEWMKSVRKNKAKVEKQEEKDRKSQKLKETAAAAEQIASQDVLMPAV